MNTWIPHPTTLHGQLVDLLPLEENLFDELHAAASDKRIWEFYTGDWSERETFNRVYDATLKQRDKGLEYPFVIRLQRTGKIIGATRLMEIGAYEKRLEIGGTWLLPEYWATAINPDCKLALLTFCFEKLGAKRVQLKTQHDNVRSRKAIEKIGGVFEGVIRKHILKDDGTYRSSAYFSLLDDEWPSKKPVLEQLLERKLSEFKVR
ncbi:MAG: GNAT family N-acetyltransferase [Sandaracinaceae bacterium]|nr:GNAT family N-acetyltransferase [Sandaracinaceae bacterium]